MKLSRKLTTILLLLVMLSVQFQSEAWARNRDVRLIVQITIDQLRGDLPLRFEHRFGPGGFRYLMEKGAFYTNANYRHADTETAPGHATLMTGGTPAQHGIGSSEWWDYDKKKIVYAVEDASYPVLGGGDESTPGTSSTTSGRAPTNLFTSTIGDEIYNAFNGRSRVFAVSGKDRAAIIPGGRAGQAFWLSQSQGKFVTSTYYGKAIPDWVEAWNSHKIADSYKNKVWTLLEDKNTYERLQQDDLPYEGCYKHLGRTMPKSLHSDNEREFYKGLSRTPVNDSLVLDFVKHLIEEKQLGKMDVPDYLSVSFSSTDYVGHTWGVASLEAEDNLLRVDKNLEDLINFLDTRIGLTKVLIVLSADHGAGEISEQMVARGFQSKRIPPDEFRDYLNKELRTKFSASKDLVKDVLYPYVFFDLECLKAAKLDLRTVENVCAEVAMQYSGITFAVGRTAIMAGALPSDQGFYAQIKNNFHPKRAGHVHVVTDPYVMFGEKVTTEPGDHGSVWTYDTYVPIMFAGPNIRSGRYSRSVSPHDVAATISNFLGIKPPSGSIGTPLSEVLQ